MKCMVFLLFDFHVIGISLWKNIRKGWEEFNFRLTIQIGNGRCTRF